MTPPIKLWRKLRHEALKESWMLRLTCSRERPGWQSRARCRGKTEMYFPKDGQGRSVVQSICEACPVRLDCLAACWAVEQHLIPTYWFGVYGGLTPSERRAAAGHRASHNDVPMLPTSCAHGKTQGCSSSDAQAMSGTLVLETEAAPHRWSDTGPDQETEGPLTMNTVRVRRPARQGRC